MDKRENPMVPSIQWQRGCCTISIITDFVASLYLDRTEVKTTDTTEQEPALPTNFCTFDCHGIHSCSSRDDLSFMTTPRGLDSSRVWYPWQQEFLPGVSECGDNVLPKKTSVNNLSDNKVNPVWNITWYGETCGEGVYDVHLSLKPIGRHNVP